MDTLIYAFLAAASTIIGGSLPLIRRDLGDRMRSIVVAFAAGVLLSVGINEMIPESFLAAGRVALIGASAGFILLYLIERVTVIHVCRDEDCDIHTFGNVALGGIGFHSMLDGFAIAVGFELEPEVGLAVAGAVLVHRFPDGVSIAAVALASRYSRSRAWLLLGIIALLALVGAAFGAAIGSVSETIIGIGLGISAGSFLYVATADLLPIAHRNFRDYGVPIAFLAGFAGILLLTSLIEG